MEGRAMPRVTNYDVISLQYECHYKVREFKGVEEALLQFVGPVESSDLLEVGCGKGHWLKYLEKQKRRPTGIDPSIRMFLLAREALAGWPLVRGRAEDLPFPNSRFDRLFCINGAPEDGGAGGHCSKCSKYASGPGFLF